MLICELGLDPDTQSALEGAGVEETDQLRRPADELLGALAISGDVLYRAICALHEYGIHLPESIGALRTYAPSEGDLEVLRLRLVEGASLREIGEGSSQLSSERVRRLLRQHFGLSVRTPAVAERSQRRKRAKLERVIALRLYRYDHVVVVSQLATELVSRSTTEAEARAAITQMVQSGSLVVQGGNVLPTARLGALARAQPSASRQPARSELA